MLYRKQHWIFIAIVITAAAHFTPISYDQNARTMARNGLVRRVRRVDPIKSTQEILKTVDFSKMFKELHDYLSPEEVRMVTTLGLVAGALRAEESMREHLYLMTDDLLESFNTKKPKENMEKLIVIEQTVNRDKSMVKVLDGMLRYARNVTTMDGLQAEMLGILKESENATKLLQSKRSEMDAEPGSEMRAHMKERLYEIREMIDNHVEQIHTTITDGAKETLRFIQLMQRNNQNKRPRPISTDVVKLDPSLFNVRRLWDQVAAEDASLNGNNFDVSLNHQPRKSRSQMLKEQRTTEPPQQKKEVKKKPRLTKGEEEEILARLTKDNDDQEIMAAISRSDDQSSNENSKSSPTSMVKLIMVNAKIDRFKRKSKTVNGKMVNRRLKPKFILILI